MKTNPLIVFRKEFDETGILFNPENGEVFGLNRTSAFIWEKLADGLPPGEILDELAKVTKPPPEAAAELNSFVAALRQKGCLSE